MISQIAFGTRPIYNVNLKQEKPDGTFELVPAKFSEFDEFNTEDVEAAREVYDELEKDEDPYKAFVSLCFLHENPLMRRYLIEIMSPEPLKKRITCLMATTTGTDEEGKSATKIGLLKSFDKNGKNLGIKGSGEALMYGAVKLAKSENRETVSLTSANDDFYKHIGFEEKTLGKFAKRYHLKSEDYDTFLSRIENKCKT